MARTRAVKKINLALQGGGAHGAFTWGALDRLLEEKEIEIEGVSATSAGAMNAAMLKSGLKGEKGDRERARDLLSAFWTAVVEEGRSSAPPNLLLEWVRAVNPDPALLSQVIEASPAFYAQDALSRAFSPAEINPLGLNPLRSLLEKTIDLDLCRINEPPHLFICATNVRTGKAKIFSNAEVTIDAILASACLPTVFEAVEIDGEAYWDGGFIGNPALYPLFASEQSNDIVIVHINPLEREDVPSTAREIANRVNEISFNSSLLRELRAINFVKRLISEKLLENKGYKDIFIHSVKDDDIMRKLGVATKITPDATLIETLHLAGRETMDTFLREHRDDLGARSSVDLPGMFG